MFCACLFNVTLLKLYSFVPVRTLHEVVTEVMPETLVTLVRIVAIFRHF